MYWTPLYANKHKYVYKTSALMVDGSEFGNFVITLINNWKQRRNESRFIMLIVGLLHNSKQGIYLENN
jgi:hypothetical protein